MTGRAPQARKCLAQWRLAPAAMCVLVCDQPAGHDGPHADESRKLLRTAEVAQLLNISPKTVARWAREGKVEAIESPGGRRYYRLGDFTSFAEFAEMSR